MTRAQTSDTNSSVRIGGKEVCNGLAKSDYLPAQNETILESFCI